MNILEVKDTPVSGIYCINYPNGKCYIGQAKNLYKRVKEHFNYAKYGHGQRGLCLCEIAIKKYNVTLEEVEILEITNNLDEREKYWIGIKKSNDKNYGYNLTPGGDCSHQYGINNSQSKFNEDDLNNIYLLLQKNEISMKEIANLYNVSANVITRINNGNSYFNQNLNYPLRNQKRPWSQKKINDYFKSEQELINLKEELKNNLNLTIEDLCAKYNIPLKTCRDINNGRKFTEYGEYSYPIRDKNICLNYKQYNSTQGGS